MGGELFKRMTSSRETKKGRESRGKVKEITNEEVRNRRAQTSK